MDYLLRTQFFGTSRFKRKENSRIWCRSKHCFFIKQEGIVTSFEFDSNYFNQINPLISSANLTLVNVSNLNAPQVGKTLNHNLVTLLENDKKNTDLDSKFWQDFRPADALPVFSQAISEADIVFVDGGARNFAVGIASISMKPEAILIVDNSDIEYVQFGIASLREAGFVEIPFYGPDPLNPYERQTSIFVISLNALKL